MRNLKKVLALVLAMAMSLSLAVTAGAAFNDQDKIVNDQAVDVCVALNIINGRTNGDFDPAGNVTRAEMAKMICIVLNGGKEPATATKAVPTYADIDGHWAEGYIEYCSAKGVVAGVGGGNFNPNGSVTGSQAAKMLLVALGYNADVEKMVGANWELYTNVLANQDGLYNELESMDPSAALSRDNAAQMIWNTLNSGIVQKTSSIENGSIRESYTKLTTTDLLKAKYGAEEWIGTLTGYNSKQEAQFAPLEENGFMPDFDAYTADDSDLIGKTVKVIYKAKETAKDPIYGLFLYGDNTYIETVKGNVTDYTAATKTDAATIEIDGVEYDTTLTSWTEVASAQPVTVTVNEDDEVIAVTPDTSFAVAEITYVGAETVNIGGIVEIEDVVLYDGYAKDDWTVKSHDNYLNKDVYTKAEIVTGEVTVVNDGDYTIGGEVYTLAADAGKDYSGVLALNTEVEVVVVDGYIYYAEKVSGTIAMTDILYVNGVKENTGYGSESEIMARVIFTDGTTGEVVVSTVLAAGAEKAVDATTKNVTDGLWAFEIEDGEYELSAITDGTDKDFEVKAESGNTGDGRIAGLRANDDAVVFVKETKDNDIKISVLSGADVKAWDKETSDIIDVAYANKTAGYAYVELAAITLTEIPGASADDVYGYVVADLGDTTEDNKDYSSFSVWTGTKAETFKVDKNTEIAKGAFVKIADGKISAVTDVAAVEAFDGESVKFYGIDAEYNVTSDTKVIYVNTKGVAGAEGGAIAEATDHNDKYHFEYNVVYVVDGTDKDATDGTDLLAIFVDANNDLDGKGYYDATPKAAE